MNDPEYVLELVGLMDWLTSILDAVFGNQVDFCRAFEVCLSVRSASASHPFARRASGLRGVIWAPCVLVSL